MDVGVGLGGVRLGSQTDDQQNQAEHEQAHQHEAHDPPAVLLVLSSLGVLGDSAVLLLVAVGLSVGLGVTVHQRYSNKIFMAFVSRLLKHRIFTGLLGRENWFSFRFF